jgi:hypothetical protein
LLLLHFDPITVHCTYRWGGLQCCDGI